jgi:hypothetical protein
MSDRAAALLDKALRSLRPAERHELLHAVLMGHLSNIGSSTAGMAWPGLSGVGVDRDRLAALLGPDDHSPATSRGALKVLPVRLPEADHDRLKDFCKAYGFSMAVVIRILLERFLDEHASDNGLKAGGTRKP